MNTQKLTTPTTMRRTFMEGQILKRSETSFVRFEECSFAECDLAYAKFDSCAFVGCSFSGANLASAKFVNCRFVNCEFLGANFYSCEIDESLLIGCSFFGANGDYVFCGKETFFYECLYLERLTCSPFFECAGAKYKLDQ